MVRRLSILLVALVLAVAAAGCGGGNDESASGDTTTTETVTEDTTTDETTTESTDTDTDATFNWASEDCQNLMKAYVGLSAAIGAASGGQDVSGDIEAFAKYADEVPDEIKADVQTLASAYGAFLDDLEDLGLKPGQIPSADQMQALEAASKSLGDSDVQAASERLNAWTTANCT